MKELANEPLPPPSAVFIDGKRYNTLILETKEKDKQTRRGAQKVLEHIAVANAETQDFMGEFTPESGSGKSVADGLKTFFNDKASWVN